MALSKETSLYLVLHSQDYDDDIRMDLYNEILEGNVETITTLINIARDSAFPHVAREFCLDVLSSSLFDVDDPWLDFMVFGIIILFLSKGPKDLAWDAVACATQLPGILRYGLKPRVTQILNTASGSLRSACAAFLRANK